MTHELVDGEVLVHSNGLSFGQARLMFVQMIPSCLNNSEVSIVQEERDGAPEEVRIWHKVGIEDGNELTSSRFQAGRQGTRLKTLTIGAMDQPNIDAPILQIKGYARCDLCRQVSRVIQNLNFESISGVLKTSCCPYEPLDDLRFIEYG